jgi:hypothetical protein
MLVIRRLMPIKRASVEDSEWTLVSVNANQMDLKEAGAAADAYVI